MEQRRSLLPDGPIGSLFRDAFGVTSIDAEMHLVNGDGF
jgi:hypothetical protein